MTPAPRPGPELGDAFLTALDEAATEGPVIAGGISFGAHLAAEWALRNPDRCAGLLLALPGWLGAPGESPGAVSARLGADRVRAAGVHAALAELTGSVDAWLADELHRAWLGYGAGLADALDAAAGRPAPARSDLGGLTMPVGVAGCVDDPIHPLPVAREWAAAVARGALCTTSLDIIGADPEALGRAAVLAWLHAGGHPPA
ncbi:alpha/beta hydrolase [Actinophytocola sp.]|uniref:alpha/beta fold hydrolase n=1 Tax=Actinophytocola sp. TaxID=1872138 RepID=UPI002D7F8021|nr:alpha/beta hydrolase [Actinophytocola sp.]HET9140008.1 alpha/beta hydrolase [Actinophytocola sp.]